MVDSRSVDSRSVDSRSVDSRVVDRTLVEARTSFVAPPGARARVRARLEAGGAFGVPRGAGNVGGSALVRSIGVARSTVAVLVGLGFGAGYWLGFQHSRPAEADRVASIEHVEVAPRAVEAVEVGANPSAPVAPDSHGEPPAAEPAEPLATELPAVVEKAPRRAHRAAPRASRAGGDEAELALLQRAERALRAGEAELALSFVSELEQRYPASPFREERGAARIMAECALGRPGAGERAAIFLRERPASVYSDRVRQKCTSESADGSREPGH